MKAMYKTKVIVSSEKYPGLYDELKKQKIYGATTSDKNDSLRPATDEEVEYAEALGKESDYALKKLSKLVGGDPEPPFFVMDVLAPSKSLLEMGIATDKLKTPSIATLSRLDAITNNKYLDAHSQTNLGNIKNIVNLLKK